MEKKKRFSYYHSAWEIQFPWVRRAPGDSQSQNAYCTVCRKVFAPKPSLLTHQQCSKHKKNLESGLPSKKLLASGDPFPAGEVDTTKDFSSAGGHHYRPVWEIDFPWVRRAPGDIQTQNAFCAICHEILLPTYNSLLEHLQTKSHADRESVSSYAKLQASQDAYCTVCEEILQPIPDSLLKHRQTSEHLANLDAKMEASPVVAEWKNVYPWVSDDPLGMLSI